VDACSRSLCPAREATYAIPDSFLTQGHYLDLSAGFTHASDKVIHHQFSLTLAAAPWAGIKCQYLHGTPPGLAQLPHSFRAKQILDGKKKLLKIFPEIPSDAL
jgi:hypothetical protein